MANLDALLDEVYGSEEPETSGGFFSNLLGNISDTPEKKAAREASFSGLSFDPRDANVDINDVTGKTRTFVQGLTSGGGDEIAGGVAGVGALFTEEDFWDGYDRGRDESRASLQDYRDRNPGAAAVTETVGSFFSPFNKLSKAKGVLGAVGNAVTEGGVTGFLSGEGGVSERADQAQRSGILSGLIGGASRPVENLIGGVSGKLDDWGTGSELPALGIKKRAINKAGKRAAGAVKAGDDIPLLNSVKRARAEGLIEPGQDNAERILNLQSRLSRSGEQINEAANLVDDLFPDAVIVGPDDFSETLGLLSTVSKNSPEHIQLQEEIISRIGPIGKNINTGGTLDTVLDEKRKVYGLAYQTESRFGKDLEEAIGRDLKRISDARVAQAAASGAVPEEVAEQFFRANKDYGEFSAVQKAYLDDIAADPKYGAKVAEDIIAQLRTSGGGGVPLLLNDATNLEAGLGAAALGALRTEKGIDTAGKLARGAKKVIDNPVTRGVGAVTDNIRAGYAGANILDEKEELSVSSIEELMGIYDELSSDEGGARSSDQKKSPEPKIEGPALPISWDGYTDVLGKRESNNDYSAVNSIGFSGKYQFGLPALVDVGLVKPEYAKMGNKALRNPDVWQGDLSLEKFLSSPELQEEAMQRYTEQNFKTLQRIGVITEDSTPEEIAGALMAAHLKGPGGAKRYLLGGDDNQDAYGTATSEYYQLGKNSQRRA